MDHIDSVANQDNAPVSERAILYCDESGNTGPNYLDASQPFYVLAGWLVPDRSNEQAWVAVEEARKRLSPQAQELKTATLLKGENQKNATVELFKTFGKLGAIPVYIIAEKRYCVCGKIVETFLDPAYNSLVSNGITGDRETKQEIANLLYDRLPEDSLVKFAQAYRNPSTSSLSEALNDIAEQSKEHLNPELANALLGSSLKIDEIAAAEAEISPVGNVSTTLNMPCLVSFLMMAEGLGQIGFHRPIHIVHDSQHAYEEGYKKIFKLHRGLTRLFSPLPNDEGVSFGRLDAVVEFETADSRDRLPIQAADALAGVIHHLMRLAMSGTKPSNADIELAKITLPPLLFDEIKVAWPIWSDVCVRRVSSSLILNAIRPEPKSEDELQKIQALSDAQSAPALPALQESSDSNRSFKLPSPIFAICSQASKYLMILTPTDDDLLATDGQAVPMVPLFSTKPDAEKYLDTFTTLTEEQEVVSFDGVEMISLAEGLDFCSEYSEMVVFDPCTDRMQHLYLPAFVEGLRAILNRIERLLKTGLDRVVLERTTLNGREALSMLLSDGRYGAMWAPVGDVVTGATRAEALQMLQSSDSADSSNSLLSGD